MTKRVLTKARKVNNILIFFGSLNKIDIDCVAKEKSMK